MTYICSMLFGFFAFICAAAQPTSQRPNILFIPIDDLRPELGCYGNTIIYSPNIDALSKNGVVFNNAYTQQAVCNPSRASLLTGLRPDKTKVWDLYTDFRTTVPTAVTLPQYFKQNGYLTINSGKAFHNTYTDSVSWSLDLHVDGFPFDPDAGYAGEGNLKIIEAKKQERIAAGKIRLDKYGQWYIKANATDKATVNDDAYYDGAQTTMVIEQIKKIKSGNQPFFLSVGYYKPHLPFNAPQKYWDLYNPTQIPLAKNQFVPANTPEYAVHGDQELRFYDDFKDLPLPKEARISEERQRKLLHGYYACVSYIDAQIGRLIQTLKDEGLYENTIIVLWSDHGWKLGEHNSWAKQTNFEIDTRVPLIISGKNVAAKGKRAEALVELLDIYPTLCSLAGLPVPSQTQGNSLIPLLKNPSAKWNYNAHSQFLLGRFWPNTKQNNKMGYSIRTKRYRYTEWYEWTTENTRGKYLADELYDHETDAAENINIAGSPDKQTQISKLKKLLQKDYALK